MADEPTTIPAAAPVAEPTPAASLPDVTINTVPASALFDDLGTPDAGSPLPVDAAANKSAADKAAADKAAAAPKPADVPPAAPAAAPKPADVPPAAPAAAPKPEDVLAAAAPKPETKIKLGNREYTLAELTALAEKGTQPAPAAQPTTAAPAPEVKPPTPEETAAIEKQWTENFLKETRLDVTFTKEDVETLLEGGDDAAKVLSDRIRPALGQLALKTRESIYNELNPILAEAGRVLQPLLEQNAQLENVMTEQLFVSRHSGLADQLPKARQVAAQLLAQYPKECATLSKQEYVDEIAAQTDRILQQEYKQFNPNATDTWREALARQKAAPATPAAQPAAAPATPAAQPAAAPATPAPVQPPASNSPAATGGGGGADTQDKKWHKSTANSLQT